MSEDAKPITIRILDKDYPIACREEEREHLFTAAEYLNRKVLDLRQGGKTIGNEKLAVMAALNIANEFLDFKRRTELESGKVDTGLDRLQVKLSAALNRVQKPEPADSSSELGVLYPVRQ